MRPPVWRPSAQPVGPAGVVVVVKPSSLLALIAKVFVNVVPRLTESSVVADQLLGGQHHLRAAGRHDAVGQELALVLVRAVM